MSKLTAVNANVNTAADVVTNANAASSANAADANTNTSNAVDFSAILKGRTASYGLLSRLFRQEVDSSLLNELMGMHLPAHTGNEKLDRAYRLLQAFLSSIWERTLSDLAKDYVRVFIGNSVDSFSAAYPVESVHTTSLRLVMQDSRDEVLAIYRSAGIDKASSWHEGEDHLSLELEFMQVIGQRAEQADQNHDDAALGKVLQTQLNFLEDHLINWVPALAQEMDKFAKTDFYRALGSWVLGFLETDREFLHEVLRIEE